MYNWPLPWVNQFNISFYGFHPDFPVFCVTRAAWLRSMINSFYKKLQPVLVVTMYLIAFASGWNVIFRPENLAINFLYVISLCLIMTYWCVIDSRIRGYPILHSFYFIIIFLWPVAVPVYLIWSRGFWGLTLAIIHLIGLYLTCVVSYHLAGYLVYGDAWLSLFI